MVTPIVPSREIADKGNPLMKAAMIYATRLGFQVLPLHSVQDGRCTCGNSKCSSIGKHPITRNGVKDSSNDLTVIQDWWTRYPFANVGIRTGQASGIWVLDVDTKGTDGRETLRELEKEHGQLPDTVTAITGSGGLHILFRYEEGIGNKVGFAPSLDARSDNGFVVAAPSVHQNGRRYEYELSSHIMETPIAQAPQWLVKMISEPFFTMGEPVKRKPSSHWQKLMQGLSEGDGRNSAAASLTGHLLSKKVDLLLVYELLHLWNERNSPPLDREELNRTIISIANKEAERRGVR